MAKSSFKLEHPLGIFSIVRSSVFLALNFRFFFTVLIDWLVWKFPKSCYLEFHMYWGLNHLDRHVIEFLSCSSVWIVQRCITETWFSPPFMQNLLESLYENNMNYIVVSFTCYFILGLGNSVPFCRMSTMGYFPRLWMWISSKPWAILFGPIMFWVFGIFSFLGGWSCIG